MDGRTAADRLLEDVGRRIAELRRARGLTQAMLAEALGVSPRYVQSMEAGEENLGLRSLHEVAVVLEETVSALFVVPQTRARRRAGRPKRA